MLRFRRVYKSDATKYLWLSVRVGLNFDKNMVECAFELSETIFHIEFHVVQHMLDILAINYQKNWCFYCDQHKSLKHCVVCADGTF